MGQITFLVGFMGSGKSYTGRRWAAAKGWDFVDLDQRIEAEAGQSIAQIFEQSGEAGFRELERHCLHQLANVQQPTLVATGGGAPCFFDNMAWMNAHGRTVWLRVPIPQLKARLWPDRHHRPLLSQVAESDFESVLSERLLAREPWYAQAQEIWDWVAQHGEAPVYLAQSTPNDTDQILYLYDCATAYQKTKPNVVSWPKFERSMVTQEIDTQRQWKLTVNDEMVCTWAITFDDPLIWGERNADPAVYIHRIATNPNFRGGHWIAHILAWAVDFAQKQGKQYVRLDTVGENKGLIAYYQKGGFTFLGLFPLTDTDGLPAHYHKATVSLFEKRVW